MVEMNKEICLGMFDEMLIEMLKGNVNKVCE